MKAHQDIFTAKLHELEQQYECLRKRLEICNAQSHRQIHRELESARQEYNSLELRLKQIVKNSRSPAVSSLAKVQLEYSQKTERLLKNQITADLHSDANTPGEDREEASALYAEYAIDFASMAVKYALLASLSALDMQTEPNKP
ncbi:MAG TPA: hypothetical protein H9738_07285 [Candidatus Blautia pullistercoris]|uniref:Uncharacterized protein n=1 Tax=Candidatus Blautia pullistercoris TaxID=2838499 RepID=A0A9D2AMH3_9FIRM|nr:hypothetical protein [Candidatus Blautia pullistercoris]